MKIILSRKGFDSSFGGIPSPIFPDGTLYSLPIPEIDKTSIFCLSDIKYREDCLGDIVSDLSKGRIEKQTPVHLDPDLRKEAIPREKGWRPIFGQVGAAQGHLRNQSVDVGDLFLFFGWFRKIIKTNGHWQYDSNSPDMHVLFGWLQVGNILKPTSEPDTIPTWARTHPHVFEEYETREDNTLYVASDSLSLPGNSVDLAGGGAFSRYEDDLSLTAPESRNRSVWKLPRWFYPANGKPKLSYHSNISRWKVEPDCVKLSSVGKGQEFIFDTRYYKKAHNWLKTLFKCVT